MNPNPSPRRLLVWCWVVMMTLMSTVSALTKEQPAAASEQPQTGTATPLPTIMPLPTRAPTATPTPPPTTDRLPILKYDTSASQADGGLLAALARLEDQMQWLADNGFTTLSDVELAAFLGGAKLPPARSVVLTFDAGGQDFASYAGVIIPALRKHHFHALFFLRASEVADDCARTFICWQTLAGWQAEGLISVGSRGFYHTDYATLTADQVEWEAGYSKKFMEARLGAPVIGFSFSADSAPEIAYPVLKAAGYQFALAGLSRPGRSAMSGDPDRYSLPRYSPDSSADSLAFGQMLLSAVAPRPPAATAALP